MKLCPAFTGVTCDLQNDVPEWQGVNAPLPSPLQPPPGALPDHLRKVAGTEVRIMWSRSKNGDDLI